MEKIPLERSTLDKLKIIERAYTVNEIDQMRKYIKRIAYPFNEVYNAKERRQDIEHRLRTYMMAGISPDELKAQLEPAYLVESEKNTIHFNWPLEIVSVS